MKKVFAVLILFLSMKVFGQHSSPKIAEKGSLKVKEVTVYSTADSTELRLSKMGNYKFTEHAQPLETQTCIFVFPKKTFQTFMGIGGAITDASAEVFATLPAEKQKELLDAYYSKENGIGYTVIRTNIHSCDFSSDSYIYVKEGDSSLKSFSVDHDLKFRIPLIKRAMETSGHKVHLFASPWSPPAFMKSNNNMLHGGKLLPAYYQSWANYYVKFIKSYQAAGVPVWGLTVQNEPMATQQWESCIYTAQDECDFLKKSWSNAGNRWPWRQKNNYLGS
jgi:glucosylceramidase